MNDLNRLGVCDAAALLGKRAISASELTAACLARIRECDGPHSHEGDPELGQRVGARLRGGRASRPRRAPTSA